MKDFQDKKGNGPIFTDSRQYKKGCPLLFLRSANSRSADRTFYCSEKNKATAYPYFIVTKKKEKKRREEKNRRLKVLVYAKFCLTPKLVQGSYDEPSSPQ